MPSDAQEPAFGPADQERIRGEVRAAMTVDGTTMKDVARGAGIPYGTFSSWMGGTYAGRTERYAEQVQRWLESRKAASRTRALAPRAPAFVATPTAEAILGCLEHAQYLSEFVVITGAPGVGKTSTCTAYQARNPNVWHVTAEPVHGTPRALLEDIAETLGFGERGLSTQRISRMIRERLRGTQALLIIDEAQHLSSSTLDQLRTLHDLAQCGIALVGNDTVFGRLEGGTKAAHYAQLSSRVGMRLARPKPLKGDIELLLDAWKIEGPTERALLHVIARKPGALRSMTKVLRVAHMLAGAEGAEAVSETHLRSAWERHAATPDAALAEARPAAGGAA